MKKVIGIVALSLATACGGKNGGTPTAPSTATPSRVIGLSGNLAFGNVRVGASADALLRISNSGTSTLTVTGMTGPGGYTASWTSGTISAGQTQEVTIRFAPTEARAYNGTLSVNGDFTSGTNTIAVSGVGEREPFSRTGSGNTVFDLPMSSTAYRVRIYGRWSGRGTSNFIVHIGGRSVVNAILRDQNPYEGVHLTNGGVVEIVSSENIAEWRFTEER